MSEPFIHLRMPDSVAYNFSRDSSFQTEIATLENASETRNINWDTALREWSAEFERFTVAEFALLDAMFNAVYGSGYGFLFRDWFDYQIAEQALGLAPAGSTPVQLYKDYIFGANVNRRIIMKPVDGTLILLQAGVPKTVVMDPTTGLLVPVAPWIEGAALEVQYVEFDCGARFRNDKLSSNYVNFNAITTNAAIYEIIPPPVP